MFAGVIMTSMIKASHVILPVLWIMTAGVVYRFLTLRLLICNRPGAASHCVAIDGGLNNSVPCGGNRHLRVVRDYYH
jgi:hypothetical protein